MTDRVAELRTAWCKLHREYYDSNSGMERERCRWWAFEALWRAGERRLAVLVLRERIHSDNAMDLIDALLKREGRALAVLG